MNKNKLKIKSTENFINFIRRFKSIEKGLLLEIDSEKMRAESHSVDRGIVKSSSLELEKVLEGDIPNNLIKIGIFNISKLLDVFKHYDNTEELFLEIHWEKIEDDNIASMLRIFSDKLTFTLKCADTDLFIYVSQETFNSLSNPIIENKNFHFSLSNTFFNKINSLCDFDSAEEKLTIKLKSGEIHFYGETFNYRVDEKIEESKEVDFSFYKSRFSSIDAENSIFYISSDKLLIESQESGTKVIIGRVS